MGVHIKLVRNGEEHPDWDWIRVQNDRDFPSLIDYDKIIKNPDAIHHYDENEFRPTDLDALRSRIKETGWLNTRRYLHLVDLIEKYPDYWLYFSW